MSAPAPALPPAVVLDTDVVSIAMSSKWRQARFTTSTADPEAMKKAALRIGGTGVTEACPLCQREPLRFYYHRLTPPEPTMSLRSIVWVWCPSCKYCDNSHVFAAPANDYADPLAHLRDGEIGALWPGFSWFDHLDRLWGEGKLPHCFTVKHQKESRAAKEPVGDDQSPRIKDRRVEKRNRRKGGR